MLDKIREETEELEQAVRNQDEENIREELGDLLFCVVNAARATGTDPEEAIHQACEKYIRRFRFMEEEASRQGRTLENLSREEMGRLYQQARLCLEGKAPPDGP